LIVHMKLSQLLENVTVSKLLQTMVGQMVVTQDREVNRVQYDSRKIQRDDCFVALKGTSTDGHAFLQNAVSQGARVLVVENDRAIPDSFCMHSGVIKVVVPDTRKALARISANFFHHPSKEMRFVGITGTNGKTTTSHLIKSVLEAAGEKVGLVGTIEYTMGDRVIPATHTTPESLELNELFAAMVKNGCTSVSMEVSSHALDQSRVYGLDFAVAVFTNLTQDHLDYHGSMEKYFQAKKILFDELQPEGWAVINHDDRRGIELLGSVKAHSISYGINSSADIRATEVRLSTDGTTLPVSDGRSNWTITTPLIGRFNAYNVLAAYSAGRALGIPHDQILSGIAAVNSVRGRFERIASPLGWIAVIDYAHTPDALENCLKAIHDILPSRDRGRIITVFGAGGDRDKSKRPQMGRIAADYSDTVIVTSDNPRSEDPEKILDDIMHGIIRRTNVVREADRRKAIERAAGCAQRGDVILIAGKGHEEYQVVGKEKIHFSDREIVENLAR
jgi:UDP-N-acetylmuramoyl-L-alanyl-D-glutamate--2,6-diaminopimelate ligase